MEEIDLGNIKVISRTDLPGQRQPSQDQFRPQAVSLEEAQGLANFEIWQPAYLPSSRWELVQVLVAIPSKSQQATTTTLKYKEDAIHWLIVEQTPVPQAIGEKPKVVIPFPMWEENIGNCPTAFFTHTIQAQNQPNGQLSLLSCLWEHQGFLMGLEAPGLSPEEIAQIGESIG
jgi:hypothetical protein